MVTIIEAVIIGAIQGVTEWLPISSSGHVVIAKHLFGVEQPLSFDILLHLGSLITILFFLRKEIIGLLKGIFRWEKDSLRMAGMVILATIPIGIIGFLFKEKIESVFNSTLTVGIGLLITSCFLFLSRYPKKKDKPIGLRSSLVMGAAQAIAILPGVSRSGVTISTGFMQGVKGEDAAKFSFLLFIPAILGATVLEAGSFSQLTDLPATLIGLAVTIIIGYLTLHLLFRIIKDRRFSYFGWYTLTAGILVLAFL